jgi:hypothetical protein
VTADERRSPRCVRDVPTTVDIWDGADCLAEDGSLWKLWGLLDTACWSDAKAGNGMGPTKTSKLQASKRPRLVPIYDSVVGKLLGPVPNHQQAFFQALSDPGLRRQVDVTSASGAPNDTSLLRRLDALLWMTGSDRT